MGIQGGEVFWLLWAAILLVEGAIARYLIANSRYGGEQLTVMFGGMTLVL